MICVGWIIDTGSGTTINILGHLTTMVHVSTAEYI
jgi:hypothetical protein